ncbi:MAG: hypothetical protein KTR27_09855 [Leptolyngbyaceae cyanobacterium MAG.088]|nr:hypothetical protein [Leptolyngbyaceae cyanobacterium MAG.088]
MGKILQELDPFFWMVAAVVAGITIVDVANVQMVSPYSDFVQAMTEPVEQAH